MPSPGDRKSTRLNSSHLVISYAVFCLKKKTLWIILLHPTGFNGSQPVSDRVEYQRRHGLKAASGLDLDIDEIIGNHFRAFDTFYLCLLSNMQVNAILTKRSVVPDNY